MVDRKRRDARPSLEPMEGRELLSGLLVALQAAVPTLSLTQEVAIATTLGHPAPAGHVSALAGAGGSGGGGSGGGGGSSGGLNNTNPTSQSGVYQGNGSSGNNGVPAGPNAAATFPNSPILGSGTPTAAELAREKFVARFSGPMAVKPGRFTDQEEILYLRGLGGSTPNFFLRADYSLAIVIPAGFNATRPAGTGGDPAAAGYVPPVTGFAFLDDKNNNSGGVVGLDLLADPTSFDAKGRPTRMTFTADPNVYGGIFFVDSAVGVVNITYGKNSATSVFNGRIYTSGLTSPFQNVDLYAKHSG